VRAAGELQGLVKVLRKLEMFAVGGEVHVREPFSGLLAES